MNRTAHIFPEFEREVYHSLASKEVKLFDFYRENIAGHTMEEYRCGQQYEDRMADMAAEAIVTAIAGEMSPYDNTMFEDAVAAEFYVTSEEVHEGCKLAAAVRRYIRMYRAVYGAECPDVF